MKYERIRMLRENKNLTQKQLSEILCCSEQSYARYENGERELPIKMLIQLVQLYNTSADYIVGLTDNPAPYPPTK